MAPLEVKSQQLMISKMLQLQREIPVTAETRWPHLIGAKDFDFLLFIYFLFKRPSNLSLK